MPGTSNASRARVSYSDGVLTAWTPEFTVERSVKVDVPSDAGLLDATEYLSQAIFTLDGVTYLWLEGTVCSVEMNAMAAAILRDNSVLLVGALGDAQGVAADNFVVALLDSAARELARANFAASQAIPFATLSPARDTLLVEFAMGDHGNKILEVSVSGNHLQLQELSLGGAAAIAAFSPDGSQLFLLPYGGGHDSLRIVSWPGLEALAKRKAADIELHRDKAKYGFDLSGGFFSQDTVLALAVNVGVLAAWNGLQETAAIELTGMKELTKRLGKEMAKGKLGKHQVEAVFPVTANTFAAVLWWPDAPRLTTLWHLG